MLAPVVTLAGIINTLADLLIDLWRADQVSEITAQYKGLPLPARIGSLQAAVDATTTLEPKMKIRFIAFPAPRFPSRIITAFPAQ